MNRGQLSGSSNRDRAIGTWGFFPREIQPQSKTRSHSAFGSGDDTLGACNELCGSCTRKQSSRGASHARENTCWGTTRQKAKKETGYFRVPQLEGILRDLAVFLIVNLEGALTPDTSSAWPTEPWGWGGVGRSQPGLRSTRSSPRWHPAVGSSPRCSARVVSSGGSGDSTRTIRGTRRGREASRAVSPRDGPRRPQTEPRANSGDYSRTSWARGRVARRPWAWTKRRTR